MSVVKRKDVKDDDVEVGKIVESSSGGGYIYAARIAAIGEDTLNHGTGCSTVIWKNQPILYRAQG